LRNQNYFGNPMLSFITAGGSGATKASKDLKFQNCETHLLASSFPFPSYTYTVCRLALYFQSDGTGESSTGRKSIKREVILFNVHGSLLVADKEKHWTDIAAHILKLESELAFHVDLLTSSSTSSSVNSSGSGTSTSSSRSSSSSSVNSSVNISSRTSGGDNINSTTSINNATSTRVEVKPAFLLAGDLNSINHALPSLDRPNFLKPLTETAGLQHFLGFTEADFERNGAEIYPETRRPTVSASRRLSIDHIFVKGHRRVIRKRFWMDHEFDWNEVPSDHMPLVAEVEFGLT